MTMSCNSLNSRKCQSRYFYLNLGIKNWDVTKKIMVIFLFSPKVFPFIFLLEFDLVSLPSVWELQTGKSPIVLLFQCWRWYVLGEGRGRLFSDHHLPAPGQLRLIKGQTHVWYTSQGGEHILSCVIRRTYETSSTYKNSFLQSLL